jgi:rubrerythrin
MTSDNNAALLRRLKTILDLELTAAKMYEEHISEFEDSKIRDDLDEIRTEELVHATYARNILNIAESRLK